MQTHWAPPPSCTSESPRRSRRKRIRLLVLESRMLRRKDKREDLDLTLDDVHLMDSKEEMLMVLVVTPFNS